MFFSLRISVSYVIWKTHYFKIHLKKFRRTIKHITFFVYFQVCLAYQTGKIAANLHYVTPHDDVPAMRDGRMRVVTDNKPFGRSYAAINSLSLSGINGHLLLKGQYKPKVPKWIILTLLHLLLKT